MSAVIGLVEQKVPVRHKCELCGDPIIPGVSQYWVYRDEEGNRHYYHDDRHHDCFRRSGLNTMMCVRGGYGE